MTRRPNILIVCTDQQRTDTLSCYGARHIDTPGFDRIAREGVRFTRAYAPSAVCTPSRVSLLSGQYAGRHKVWSIGVNTGDDVRMMQHDLAADGYRTALIGKAHLEAYQVPPEQSRESVAGFERGYGDWSGPYYGFQQVQLALGHVNYGMTGHYGAWLRERFTEAQIEGFKHLIPRSNTPSFGGEGYDWDLPVAAHNSVWAADRAVDYIGRQDGTAPFFLFVSFQDPHHPHALPRDYANRIRPDAIPQPRYSEGELDDRPEHFRLAREGRLQGSRYVGSSWPMSGQGHGADFRQVSRSAAVDGRRQYYGMAALIDDQLPRIWAALEAAGLYDDTLIIVTSDHGELLGDHGLWMKGPFHYEEVIRVPLLMKPPADMCSPSYERGWDEPVSLVDICPTCLHVAGIARPPELDGVSLLHPERNRHVLVETVQEWHALSCLSIIGSQHKFTCYPEENFGELTDFDRDPFEQTNRFAAEPETRSEMLQALMSLQYGFNRSPKTRIGYA